MTTGGPTRHGTHADAASHGASTRPAAAAAAAADAAVADGLDHEFAIVGAGFSGLAVAVALDEAGFSDFVILDRDQSVDGVRHVNTGPGIAVDVPRLSRSFSFAKSAGWSRVFTEESARARDAEAITDRYGLRARLRLGVELTAARFDETRDRWLLRCADGRVLRVRHVVAAAGALTRPKEPDNPGLASFRDHRRPHVTLATRPIEAIETDGVRTADGRLHRADTVISATGFTVFETDGLPSFPVVGRGGLDLETFWKTHRERAYEGVSVPGFPNLFHVLGMNGHDGASGSPLVALQSKDVVRCLEAARTRGATRVEVRREVNDRYVYDTRSEAHPASDNPAANDRALGRRRIALADVARALATLPGIGRDPNRTDLIGDFIAALTGPSYLALRRTVLRHPEGAAVLHGRKDLRAALADRAALARMPEGSFGRAYLAFTDARALSPEGIAEAISRQVGRDLESVDATLAARVVDQHDLWHVLYGWDTDILGEVHLLGFSYGQLGSFGWLALGVLSVNALVMLGHPEGIGYFARAVRIGRAAPCLAALDWESRLARPLETVRRELEVPTPKPYEKLPVETFERLRSSRGGYRAVVGAVEALDRGLRAVGIGNDGGSSEFERSA